MENGTILNHTYQVLYPIGSGGLGEIYLGYHRNLQKYVIIKKVKDHCTSILNNRIEVDILKSLHHTYLPQVYDFIQIDDGIFTVMDYIPGHDMKYYLDAGYQFSEEQVVLWMKQMCQVLDYLHTRTPCIIHCDIKPGNIMITEEGNICLIDFNISLDGENNKELVGLSSFYASPEQVKKAEYKMRYGSGDQVKMDERTDIYSMGAVFYYVMTGIRPNVREGNPLPLSDTEHLYSEALANIVDKAMEENPAKRFRSAAKMLDALEHQEVWGKEYRKLSRAGTVLDLIAGCLGVLLVCLVVLGYRGMKTDDFFEAYEGYMKEAEAWSGQTEEEQAAVVVTDGIRFLNNSEYHTLLEEYPVQKANVLYAVGQASLFQEDNEQAEKYLKEALRYDKSNADIYRDLALSQIAQGKLNLAQESMEEALVQGLSRRDGALIQAEIAMAKKEYDSAYTLGCEAAKSDDSQIALRAACLVLDSCEMVGNMEDGIAFLQSMAESAEGIRKEIWLRKEGELCIRAAEKGEEGFLRKAADCYEELSAGGYAQLSDLYNLASVYNSLGDLEKGKKLLLEMAEEYPKEYKVYLQLSYICYRQQNNSGTAQRDYAQVQKYYRKARTLCEEQGKNPDQDMDMVQMKEIVEQLRQQGWVR